MSRKTTFRHRNLPQLLLQAREAMLCRFRPLLKANGLSEQQWRIVRELAGCESMEPRQIVRRCGISSPSLAGVLARMDEEGWIRRERFEDDARRVRVTLTPKGRAVVGRLISRVESRYDEIEALMGRRFMHSLYGALDTLIARLDGGTESDGGE